MYYKLYIILLELFDTSGQEDYDLLRPLSYPNTDIFLICFAVDDPASFLNVRTKWLPEIHSLAKGVPYILVGTKIELREEHGDNLITTAQGEALCREIGGYKYEECSAADNLNVKKVFDESIRIVIS